MNLKLELIFKVRVGIVADISTIIAQHGDNIASMDVVRHEDRAHVYLETEKREQAARFEKLFETLSKVDDLIQTVRFSLKERISTIEKQIVMETLQASRSIREAARRLGVSHTAVLNKFKKWKFKEPVEI